MMTEKELTEKIEKFVKDDSKLELQLFDKTCGKTAIFVKQRLGNSLLLYGKYGYLGVDIRYTIHAKYYYCGFFNLTQNKLFDVDCPLIDFVDKAPLTCKGIENELYKKIIDSIAKEITENTTIFEGMKLSKEDENIEDIIQTINENIFNGEKCKALKDVIYVDFYGDRFKGEKEITRIDDFETILGYLDYPDEVVNQYKNEILQKRKKNLFIQYERHKIYIQKFNEIMNEITNDKSSIICKKKALKDKIEDINMKTIKVTIMKKGKTFTFKADANDFKYYHSDNKYNYESLSRKDYKTYTQLFGYIQYTFDEIQKITYGKEELYVKD